MAEFQNIEHLNILLSFTFSHETREIAFIKPFDNEMVSMTRTLVLNVDVLKCQNNIGVL